MKPKYLCWILGLALLLGIAGCDDDDSSSNTTTPPVEEEEEPATPVTPSPALVRLLHAVEIGRAHV